MSFILDALRKSDQQRQRSVTPTLMTAQAPVAESRQPALWWYGLLAVVLIGVGILIGWMHQWQSEPAVPAIQSDPGRPLESSNNKFTSAPLAVLPAPSKKPENQQPSLGAMTVTQSIPPPSGADTLRDLSAKPVMISPQPAAVAASPSDAPAPVQEEHARTGPGDVDLKMSMALTELPLSLQQEIPKLSVLVHSYSSKPKSSYVFINDRKWREEEYPVPGLKLEQITPDGMVFSYRGYRFRRGINP